MSWTGEVIKEEMRVIKAQQERIAALELSNQRLRQALEYIREEYLFTAHGFHVASKALSASEPSKVMEVLRQCEEALKLTEPMCPLLCVGCRKCKPRRDALTRLEAFLKDDLRESGIEELTKLRSQLTDAREVIRVLSEALERQCGPHIEVFCKERARNALESTREKRERLK